MKVSYLDFWPGFDINCNWFNLLLKDSFPEKTIQFVSDPNESDVIFFSCFGQEHKKYKESSQTKILYIGENVRADFSVADYCLSFDFDSYDGKNFRLPHWYLYVNWWNELNFPHARISVEKLSNQYEPNSVWGRSKFCSIMIGNPVSNRIEVANKLNTYKQVDGFGRVFGNPYSGCKIELLQNYRWNICFENSIYEGYVTEKFLEAKIAGCIPIYYGPFRSREDFNENCCINYFNYNSAEELLDRVTEIDRDEVRFRSLASEPLFNKIPDLEQLKLFIRKCIG